MIWRRLRARNGVGLKPQDLISRCLRHHISGLSDGRVGDTPMLRATKGLDNASHNICDAHIWTRYGTNGFLGRQSRQGRSNAFFASMLQSLDPDG